MSTFRQIHLTTGRANAARWTMVPYCRTDAVGMQTPPLGLEISFQFFSVQQDVGAEDQKAMVSSVLAEKTDQDPDARKIAQTTPSMGKRPASWYSCGERPLGG